MEIWQRVLWYESGLGPSTGGSGSLCGRSFRRSGQSALSFCWRRGILFAWDAGSLGPTYSIAGTVWLGLCISSGFRTLWIGSRKRKSPSYWYSRETHACRCGARRLIPYEGAPKGNQCSVSPSSSRIKIGPSPRPIRSSLGWAVSSSFLVLSEGFEGAVRCIDRTLCGRLFQCLALEENTPRTPRSDLWA